MPACAPHCALPLLFESPAMPSKKILIVHAHPEPTSLTHQLAASAATTLAACGHAVMETDLYALGWKAVFDAHDFPSRADPERLSFIAESGNAFSHGLQTPDVAAEQS